ncbi:hypothetical protein [Pseudoxanthomonas sp. UTMC 1351]|uniref:hypothetical protein n=1 Tax=Pseudoxanthomonas sp. UTMC 1351 TaxID=2695853 RepID=UPI0034CFEC2D
MTNNTILFLCFLVAAPAAAQDQTQVKSIFAQYQSRAKAFDAGVADLYCDTAVIRNVRTYPDGQQRTLELPAPKYKELIRAAMPLAQAKGDYSTYSDVVFTPENVGFRITAVRYSVVKQYSSPVSLLVGDCGDGSPGILEELSQSRP